MPIAQPDLFAAPGLPGFAAAPDVVDLDEEAVLIALIEGLDLAPFRFQGWLGKRRTISFGWHYDFDTRGFAPAEPIPAALLPVRERAGRFAGLAPDDLVQALVTRYDPGAGIGWHRDRPVFEHVVGVSLGAAATMRFRRRRDGGFDRHSAALPPRAVYHLTGEARWTWEHSIAPIDSARSSITFRSLAPGPPRRPSSERSTRPAS